MGGAERSARKKRQAQTATSRPPAVARHKSSDRKKVVIGVVVVVLLLGAVLGGVIYTNSQKNATEGQSIDEAATGANTEASYPVRRDGAVVVVGEDAAKVTLDVYEDFLCPVCGQFEKAYGKDLEQHVKDGTVRLRYHMLPMLNEVSDPPGYSMDSANAGLCAADAGKFPQYHVSLFDSQPEEGSRGWDKQQLAKLGKDLGITAPAFESCVESGKYESVLAQSLEKVRNTEYLKQDLNGQKSFGTPTVANGQKVVDISDPKWLDTVVGAAG
ncbi:MAG: DsbA family protein [Actinophytocola sp.]|uniref:DsbA family protein n=1 Tax=Actinophytocola sp. TaxID=1872138 RepID=UPI003D6A4045